MKTTIILFGAGLFLFSSCHSKDNSAMMTAKIDSLQQQLNHVYKPGFGEFMSSIQVHHNKLWFAGQNQNWKLADFEIHEIMEAIDNIKELETDRPESKKIDMLNPALDSINHAIQEQNSTSFKNSFIFLTQTCNNCHIETNFEFNQVKIPETPPFSNQVFTKPAGN
ncbi:MAG: hypothetical protein JSU05_16485, partial [Bacteroidetes bacterium]|nr:hypothetical protein [Bacteroidota bacterium]